LRIVKVPYLFGYKAMAIYPFVLVVGEMNLITMNHERIHFEQIKKDGFFAFYLSYLFQYFKNRILGMKHFDAYMNISYEIEAYGNERNMDYMP
jgi:hypothetical protein